MNRHSSRLLVAFICIFTCLVLFAGMLLLGGALKDKTLSRNHAVTASTNDEPSDNTLVNAPFVINVTTSEIASKDYISFTVHFKNEYSNERLFTCGRMFEEDDFESIAWSETGYDIIVALKGDQTVTYAFDGSNNWQEKE